MKSIAAKKKLNNIAEYILYLYQVEDMIRAYQFDFNRIEESLVSAYKVDEKTTEEIRNWYSNLVIMMEKEGLREKGHLQFLVNLIDDVNDFHLKLMETEQEAAYVQIFAVVAGIVDELKRKNPEARNDFELGVTAIYGFLLLRMQQREVSIDTTNAVKMLSNWLASLSKLYRDFENGDFSFE